MGPLDALYHAVNFMAPAAALAVLLVLGGRLIRSKGALALSWRAQVAINFVVGCAVLVAGLVVLGRIGAAPDGSLIGRAEQIDAVGDDAVGAQVDQALGRPFVVDRVAQGAHTQCVDLLHQGDIPQRVVAHQRLAA